ncbi:hypothetical protein DRO97_04135 [Archaeoglobales archaeon]|nr:MAG: hypothetical protein DRO97_04135 [Archaeoglobales archaeon]
MVSIEEMMQPGTVDTITKLSSAVFALSGLYLVYNRELVERKLRRDALVKILKTNFLIKKYDDKLYEKLIWKKWKENEIFCRIVFVITGFLIPIILAVSSLPILDWKYVVIFSFMLSFWLLFLLSIFTIFYIINLIPLSMILTATRIIRFLLIGMMVNFIISLLGIYYLLGFGFKDSKIDYTAYWEFFVIMFAIFLLFIVTMFFIDRKEYEAFEWCSMNCEDINKEILPKIKLLLKNGATREGKLLEFYDSNVITIIEDDTEKDKFEESILWNEIIGISFQIMENTEDNQENECS